MKKQKFEYLIYYLQNRHKKTNKHHPASKKWERDLIVKEAKKYNYEIENGELTCKLIENESVATPIENATIPDDVNELKIGVHFEMKTIPVFKTKIVPCEDESKILIEKVHRDTVHGIDY